MQDAVDNLAADGFVPVDEADLEYSVISAALFDLTAEELEALANMKNDIIDQEEAIIMAAMGSTDANVIATANAALSELEAEIA